MRTIDTKSLIKSIFKPQHISPKGLPNYLIRTKTQKDDHSNLAVARNWLVTKSHINYGCAVGELKVTLKPQYGHMTFRKQSNKICKTLTNPSSFIPSPSVPLHHPLYTAPNMKRFLILLEGVSQYFFSIISPTYKLKINNSLPESTFVFSCSGATLFQPFSIYIVKIMRYICSESGQKLVRFSSTR